MAATQHGGRRKGGTYHGKPRGSAFRGRTNYKGPVKIFNRDFVASCRTDDNTGYTVHGILLPKGGIMAECECRLAFISILNYDGSVKIERPAGQHAVDVHVEA